MGGAETRVLGKLRSSLPKQKPDRKRTGLAWSRVVINIIHEKLLKHMGVLLICFNFIFSAIES
jgi:hypothetical protein